MIKKFHLYINYISAICCIAIAVKFIFMPILVVPIYSNEYKYLMFQCDNVMRDHLIAKNRVFYDKSENSINLLKLSEVGLISCHKYDVLRKKMKSWGITDYQLSSIGLEAIEENSKDIIKYVDTHEFKY
jgi:hypothetical protein